MYTREIVFTPAYDKRHSDPKKNYGIHGVEMRCYLKGEKGVVQFVTFTGWNLPHVVEEFKNHPSNSLFPMPSDLGYHSPKPMYEGQSILTDKCPILDNKPCYYGGSTLNAEHVFKILVIEGSEAMWKYLEEYYKETFNK